ncbi:MAG TPA: hypothetical protein VMD25_12230 [Acidobacteriaceae bacterium]|nr:hypothetical protein [Acidobacteriaceae bacterium]
MTDRTTIADSVADRDIPWIATTELAVVSIIHAGGLLHSGCNAIARHCGLNSLNGQGAVGVFLSVRGSLLFLLPVLGLITQMISSSAASRHECYEPHSHMRVSPRMPASREAV